MTLFVNIVREKAKNQLTKKGPIFLATGSCLFIIQACSCYDMFPTSYDKFWLVETLSILSPPGILQRQALFTIIEKKALKAAVIKQMLHLRKSSCCCCCFCNLRSQDFNIVRVAALKQPLLHTVLVSFLAFAAFVGSLSCKRPLVTASDPWPQSQKCYPLCGVSLNFDLLTNISVNKLVV